MRRGTSPAATHPRPSRSRSASGSASRPSGLAFGPGRERVEHRRAGDGLLAPRISQHEAIARRERDGHREADTRVHARGIERSERHLLFARADVRLKAHSRAELRVGSERDGDVGDGGNAPLIPTDQRVTTHDFGPVDAREIERDPRVGFGAFHPPVRGLDAAHPNRGARARHLEPVVHADRAAGEGAGDDRPGARGREHAIDPQPGTLAVRGRRRVLQDLVERGAQVVEPAPRHRIDLDHARAVEGRPREAGLHVAPHRGEGVVVDDVGVGQRHDAVLDAEQLEDDQVFLALGHPPLASRHDEHDDIDRADAGQHVLEEPHVPGHVDEADLDSRRERGEREAEVERQPACLLFGEAVGIGARQREHE